MNSSKYWEPWQEVEVAQHLLTADKMSAIKALARQCTNNTTGVQV